MKVSVAIHKREPALDGNQRVGECAYGGYNRMYADLVVDPNTGAGIVEIHNMEFPRLNTDPEEAKFFSIARCFAPEGFGGAVIIAGPIEPSMKLAVGGFPFLVMIGAVVEPAKMKELCLIVQERTGTWREKSEKELRATMDGVR